MKLIRKSRIISENFSLVDLASVLTQIVMDFGDKCEHIEVTPTEISFRTVEVKE